MSSLKKVFFTCAIFFVALAIPTITLAYDQCEGSFTQPDGSKIIQSGVCDYAGGINIINGGAPSCSAFGKQYFSDANYHSINDDIVHCGFNGGQSYSCCAKNASSPPPGAECQGFASNSTTTQVGQCIYYTTDTNAPYTTDENALHTCTDQTSCPRVSCSTITQKIFGNSAYHGITDQVKSCPIGLNANPGEIYQCCASDTQPSPVAPPVPCTTLGPSGFCNQISTGLGQIQVNPSTIIGSLFGILLSISGGIALIIIMLSGYRIVFSQGDPEKLKGAREGLTSAIIGLLFIIFSVVILQVIGVDILHLPGLNK